MASIEKRRLGDILVNAGKLTQNQLEDALNAQVILGKRLGEILVDSGIITELDIIEAIETQTGILSVDLNSVSFDKKVVKLVSQNLCEKYMLIPFGFNKNKIKVAMSDPLNIFAVDDINISTGFEVETYIALKNDIKRFININYSSERVSKAAEELNKETLESKNVVSNIEDIDDIKNAPVVKMVDYMFKNSIEMRASDIHIEPFKNEVRIRYRIDGQLQTINTLSIESLGSLVARIKILAGLNIAEKRIPQDGRIITKVGNDEVDLRVSILPVINGEKIAIRILNRSNYKVGRDKLGISERNLAKLDRIISNPHGIVLVTGPTGSGKSTTLYTILTELNKEDVNIITVEDPVEYTINGINQVHVNPKAGMTFANSLRSILRQDPDIVMIGEIRDDETAEIAVKAAITGHLVLSTLHTNDAPSSITRLIDMGVEPFLVSASVVGVIAQRLVRKICPYCKEKYESQEYEKKALIGQEDKSLVLYRGRGCGYCNYKGYLGRVGIYEIMEITREHRDTINNTKDPNVLKDISIKNGMTTLAQECRDLVLKGITTLSELTSIALLKDI
jgi:type IV pilus assembly protein PilB